MTIVAHQPGGEPSLAFDRVADFESYPDHSDAVLSVNQIERTPSTITSAWEVKFRRGILCWTEHAELHPTDGMIVFTQVDGDVDVFAGHWKIDEVPDGVNVEFKVEFDVGIPTLDHIIDPIAEDALFENISSILRGMLGPDMFVTSAENGNGRTWSC